MYNKILDKAIKVLKVGGLLKGYRGSLNINEPHCALGALDCVIGKEFGIDDEDSPYWDLLENIRSNILDKFQSYRDPRWDIALFNNREETTVEDIIDLFERSKV